MSAFGIKADILDRVCYSIKMRLTDHKFPSGIDEALVMLSLPMSEIAPRVGLSVEVWEEDGLGTARGCWVPIRDGMFVLLRELDHAREHHGATGPVVWVDSGDAIAKGFDELLKSTLDALSLSMAEVRSVPKDKAAWLAEIKAYVETNG